MGGDIVLGIDALPVADSTGTEDRIDQCLRPRPPWQPLAVRVLRGGPIVTRTAPKQP